MSFNLFSVVPRAIFYRKAIKIKTNKPTNIGVDGRLEEGKKKQNY